MSSSITTPEGIINPPIDELLEATDSKYSLVIYAAKRARQINAYYSQLGEGLLEYVGPLVDTHVHEKPLSIALREINAGLLTSEAIEGPCAVTLQHRSTFTPGPAARPPGLRCVRGRVNAPRAVRQHGTHMLPLRCRVRGDAVDKPKVVLGVSGASPPTRRASCCAG